MKRLCLLPILGAFAGGCVAAAGGPAVIGAETLIPVGAVASVVAVVWALSRRVKGWEDMLNSVSREQGAQGERVNELKRLIITRPCVRARDICPGANDDPEERKQTKT